MDRKEEEWVRCGEGKVGGEEEEEKISEGEEGKENTRNSSVWRNGRKDSEDEAEIKEGRGGRGNNCETEGKVCDRKNTRGKRMEEDKRERAAGRAGERVCETESGKTEEGRVGRNGRRRECKK